MNARDLNTISTFLAEYGMSAGKPTPVGQQQVGMTAKAQKAERTAKAQQKQHYQTIAKVVDSELDDQMDELDDQMEEGRHHGENKRVLRAQKYAQQGEPIFEINFNRTDVMRTALDADVSCGFEAEVVITHIEQSRNGFNFQRSSLREIKHAVKEQYGQAELDGLETSYVDWLSGSELYNEIAQEEIGILVSDRIELEDTIDRYVEDQVSMDDVLEYRKQKLQKLKNRSKDDADAAAELAEYTEWDRAAWAREYVEINQQDELRDWLTADIEMGDDWQDGTVQRAFDTYDMSDWVETEYDGDWDDMLNDHNISLVGEGSLEDVADELEEWARGNSYTSDVRLDGPPDTDPRYWKVVNDPSVGTRVNAGCEYGVCAEIVSPVYGSPREMLREMNSLFEWLKENDAETNKTTGLHVTMSLTNSAGTVNPLKMALLLGDIYLLRQFDREFNRFTESQQRSITNVAHRLRTGDISDQGLAVIERILSTGVRYEKFSSINFKTQQNSAGNSLIEFRIGGNLNYHVDFNKVAKTVVRYAVTIMAGYDPDAYRQEYIKAIVKLIDSVQDGLSDAEQKEMEKGAGLDVAPTLFVDLLKTVINRDDYLDTMEDYQMAINGNDQRALSIISQLITMVEKGNLRTNARNARAVRIGMRDMNVTAQQVLKYETALVTQSVRSTEQKSSALKLRTKAFNKLSALNVAAPETSWPEPTVLKINTRNQILLIKAKSLYSILNNNAYDPADIAVIQRDDWEVVSRVMQVMDNDNADGATLWLSDHWQVPSDSPEFQQRMQKSMADFINAYQLDPRENWTTVSATAMRDPLANNHTKPLRLIIENVFAQFDRLPLHEQLRVINNVDKQKLDEIWSKTNKSLAETIEAQQDAAALPTAHQSERKLKNKKSSAQTTNTTEGAVPQRDMQRDYKLLMSAPLLGSDLNAQMQAYFLVPDPSMIREFRAQIARSGRNVDLRDTLKSYAQRQFHPVQKKQVSENIQTDRSGNSVHETIRKVKGGYRLLSKKGKNLGTFSTRSGAEQRERQVQAFKHMESTIADPTPEGNSE